MSKIKCDRCGERKNTFHVDSVPGKRVRVCNDCAKEEGFDISEQLQSSKKCISCGENFEPKFEWVQACPICFFDRKENSSILRRNSERGQRQLK